MTPALSRLPVLLLCGVALAGCAAMDGDAPRTALADSAPKAAAPIPADLDSGVRQADLMRLEGRYDDAIHLLAQLMLVAPDDARVVGEYGKALAQKGRAQEAVDFLSRATALSAADWTLYSALGVAYDELGRQDDARTAYARALALKPGEPSVLNNYALSRMMANDPAGARSLIAEAARNGGAADPKIARNIAMLEKLAPAPQEAVAAAKPAPQPVPPVKTAPVAEAALAAPRPITSLPQKAASGVVMEKVPADPLAGPVDRDTPKTETAAVARHHHHAAAKAAAEKPAPAANPAPALRMTADANP